MRRLSVFAGSFELEAAEAICAAEGIDVIDVLDLLGSLVDKSLVIADRAADSLRYRLLETVRQYAAQELFKAAGEAELTGIRDRHADYYLRVAAAAGPALTGPRQGYWLRRLDAEWDNIRAVFGYLAAEGRTGEVIRLGTALQRFAVSRAQPEVLSYLRAALEQDDSAVSALTASALLAASRLLALLRQADPSARAEAKDFAERSLAMAEILGEPSLRARALGLLSEIAFTDGDLERVQQLAEPGVALARTTGDRQLLGELLRCLAMTEQSDEENRRIRLEALDCFRQSGDELLAANELHMLFVYDLAAGRISQARAHLNAAIAAAEGLGDEIYLYFFREDLVILLLIEGQPEEAVPLVRRCLQFARRSGIRLDVCEVLFGAACCAAWQADHAKAARLHGAADVRIRYAIADGSISWSSLEERLRAAEHARLRTELGAELFDEFYRQGAMLSRQQGVELALR